MNKLIILITVLFFISCKDNKKANNTEQIIKEKTANTPKNIVVILSAVVLLDDEFEVYYYEEGQESFDSQDFVKVRVLGSPISQEIRLQLPEEIYPERLRLDFGKNQNQNEILFEGAKLVYGSKEYVFSNQEIIDGFVPSKYISFNKKEMKLKTKVIDGKYDPYFYTRKVSNIVDYLLED